MTALLENVAENIVANIISPIIVSIFIFLFRKLYLHLRATRKRVVEPAANSITIPQEGAHPQKKKFHDLYLWACISPIVAFLGLLPSLAIIYCTARLTIPSAVELSFQKNLNWYFASLPLITLFVCVQLQYLGRLESIRAACRYVMTLLVVPVLAVIAFGCLWDPLFSNLHLSPSQNDTLYAVTLMILVGYFPFFMPALHSHVFVPLSNNLKRRSIFWGSRTRQNIEDGILSSLTLLIIGTAATSTFYLATTHDAAIVDAPSSCSFERKAGSVDVVTWIGTDGKLRNTRVNSRVCISEQLGIDAVNCVNKFRFRAATRWNIPQAHVASYRVETTGESSRFVVTKLWEADEKKVQTIHGRQK